MMALAEATATVGQRDKEWGSNNASMTMIPLTATKMMRITMKKAGGWDPPPPPGDAAQKDWRRTAANGYRQWRW
jgi:hypothetical protein